ncbi:GNAT family N-acetyltransferase [Methylobacterium haplocladii]|uniref:N-acetyltransferase domain-containing protein n=1 Tax=Methylobacterium haplocladii TaxID=1176176 RepID=A0A512IJW3_9HYPH|nr:GNAT family N-acetyltransferase [Methylobacterium haplocladii]GEO98013.1 hypothetical protein MHA02_04010 [Methylobacterium haplocladii]GJD86064.1 hypothetical protein HPGCJGGD_3961 [Methylobacterium haplocladii]GLS57914.1 hypothetical protein GCM10007887_05700 [Methylobacterium haplocladii]
MSDALREPLRNGRNDVRILCRRLWPSDRDAVRAHVLRLDPETRANRFMAALGDTAALAYAERALVADGVAIGGFVDGILRGLGELRPAGRHGPGFLLGPLAEAAFVVEQPFRREGLGSALFRRIVGAARSRGVADLHVRCLNGNGPMRLLALRHGAELNPVGSETDGAIHLDRPTPLSLWSQGLAEAFDLSIALTTAAIGRSQAAASGHGTMRSTSSSSVNSSSLPATRPRTEMPAS